MGLMFTLLGLILTGFGLFSGRATYSISLGVNVNLWWGLVILAFGVLMVLLAWRARSRVPIEAVAASDPLAGIDPHQK
jgi:hypothetical protein